MRIGRHVFIIGDIHGNFLRLNSFMREEIRENAELAAKASEWQRRGDDFDVVILQCGDMGWFFPGLDDRNRIFDNSADFLSGGRIKLHWCPGNHEDWDRLDMLSPTQPTELSPGAFYHPFGSILRLAPDLSIMFAGGAESPDRMERIRMMEGDGYPKIWWKQESITETELETALSKEKPDWIVSHTAPWAFDMGQLPYGAKQAPSQISRGMLERLRLATRPYKWFFGHFHKPMQGRIDGCDWMCLDTLDNGFSKNWHEIFVEANIAG